MKRGKSFQHNFSTADWRPKMLRAQKKSRQLVRSTASMKSGGHGIRTHLQF
jgi:hypothetical protein